MISGINIVILIAIIGFIIYFKIYLNKTKEQRKDKRLELENKKEVEAIGVKWKK